MVEWNDQELRPVARILTASGVRTNAYLVFDLEKEKPEFLTDEEWQVAKYLQAEDDEKPF